MYIVVKNMFLTSYIVVTHLIVLPLTVIKCVYGRNYEVPYYSYNTSTFLYHVWFLLCL